MANYFNLTLDTTAPSTLAMTINNGATSTTSTSVTLNITCTDDDVSQMKIWGINGIASESDASWETFATTKNVTLTTGDGTKTVYIKVRDDVYNESSAINDTIILNTSVPAVTITGPDVAKISKMSGKNTSSFTFSVDSAFVEYKVNVVPSINSIHTAGTTIGTTGGSTNMSGTGTFAKSTPISCSINGADLNTASSGDGTKIIKVFVKNTAGTWSV